MNPIPTPRLPTDDDWRALAEWLGTDAHLTEQERVDRLHALEQQDDPRQGSLLL